MRMRAGLTIAVSVVLGAASPAEAARCHHRHQHHCAVARRAHKAELPAYEFEVVFEGPHVLTPDEQAGNQAAVEATEHPGIAPTPVEEETPTEPER